MSYSDTKTRPKTELSNNDGDHERFAHYIKKKDGVGASVRIARSVVTGDPIEALCGKLWVPHKDPARYPLCPECEEIAIKLMKRR